MGKTKQNVPENGTETQEMVQPAKTKQTLVANSREELAEAVAQLKAQHPDKTLMAGAVGQKDDGTFEIQIDFINK